MDPGRFRRVIAAAALLACTAASGEPPAGKVRLLVQSTPLAGVRFYEAADLWPQLQVGDRLELARQADNPHDSRAIVVSWRGRILGYVPRRENAALAWAMDRGERLDARISRLTSHPDPRRRLELEVYLE
jgi:hypothetical protein